MTTLPLNLISVTADYALRAAVLLAIEHPHPVTVETIADSVRVPRKVLSKIMLVLRRARLLNATRGKLGGYRLARPQRSAHPAPVRRTMRGGIMNGWLTPIE
jgi:Rrf2 family protein